MKLQIIFAVVFSFYAPSALAFPGLDTQTLGTDEMRGSRGRSGLMLDAGAGYFDGQIHTTPPDTIHSDRRFESFVRLGWDQPYGQGELRFRLEGNGMLRTEQDNLDPKIYIDERTVLARGSVDGTYLLQNGVDLFAGGLVSNFPGHTRITSTINGKSKRRYQSATLVNPRAGAAKKGGEWVAGAYFMSGAEKNKSYSESVFDGTTSQGEEVVVQPTRIAVFGTTPVGPLKAEGEFGLVKGGSFGPTAPSGRSVNDDSFTMLAAGEFPIFGSTRGRFGVYHQTLSYGDQAFMNLDNIPSTALRLETYLQEGGFRGTAGVVYGFGKDEQSQPEFNADYSFRAFGAIATLLFAF